ncbi:hypothetical protein L292_2742 [Acinetobacter junii CIP 107470 = MTCC 11364]|uniref:Uncharacterized protein n=1 Tax=Acinetobacter junii CIP 107470 = MTCC 11364 TaxID=1217666 RepID=S7WT09_ACIJU|nr:hypothetical protein L292_2742 [Acinetobacter junii CIP 107470 = MTCC 11364]
MLQIFYAINLPLEFSALFAHWRYSFKPDENGAWKFLLAKELKEVEY